MARLWTLLLLVACPAAWARDCKMDNQCSCTFDDGSGTVDLSSIGHQDGTALVQDQFAADNYAYSYNPCYPFTEGTCYNAAACQFDSANVVYYNIGDSAKVDFSFDGLNVIVTYTADDGARSSKVTLLCDPNANSPSVEVKGETSTAIYEFTVTTKEACFSGAPSVVVTVTTSISAGSVLLIVFFSVVVVYFIAGSLFMKFRRHNQGREVVPNVDFWTGLPGLVKDGVMFVVGKTCRRSGYTKY